MAVSDLLRGLSPAARNWTAAQGSLVQLAAGELLWSPGAPGDALFVLLEGELELRWPPHRKVTRRAVRPLAIVDEIAALEGSARPTSLIATSPARLWRVPRIALFTALEQEPDAARGLVVRLSARLRRVSDALESHHLSGLGARLAGFLLTASNSRALVPLTQTEIAHQLSASREKVNRKLNAWARVGWVELSRSGVRLRDPEALRRLLGPGDGP